MGQDYLSIQIQVDQAKSIANSLYRLSGEVIPLPGELDFNFKIISDSGSYLMKVSRPGADVEFIKFQQGLLDHLARNSSRISVPVVFSDRDGNDISEIMDKSGNARKVRLLSWIEGRIWSTVNPITDRLLYSLGEQGGRLTEAFKGFDHSMAKQKLDWDVAQAGWTYEYSHLFTGKQQEIVQYFHRKH